MTGRYIRDGINLLIYGGAFIGLCASCITALSFEVSGNVQGNFDYILFIGAATAALYCVHHVIGLKKVDSLKSSERFTIIRRYKKHIRANCGLWILLSLWLFIPLAGLSFVLWLLPGVLIAVLYVLPILGGGRRLRDLGWTKILMIGWSWGWLTAFIPFYFFVEASLQLSVIHGLERMLFIILITIPFEIRDMQVDQAANLMTLPEKFGQLKTRRIAIFCCISIFLFSLLASFHFINPSYVIALTITCALTMPIIKQSYRIHDDYFFSGVTDGLMILALCVYTLFNVFI